MSTTEEFSHNTKINCLHLHNLRPHTAMTATHLVWIFVVLFVAALAIDIFTDNGV